MFHIHQDLASGQAAPGRVDPNTDLLLLPSPMVGYVRVPLWAGIQSDGREHLVICHGILRRVGVGAGWATHPDTCLLWNVRLTPVVLHAPESSPQGAELFIPVPLFPLPEGWEVITSWSYATGAHQMRTRAVSVDVPAADFAWSRVPCASGLQPRVTTR